MPSPSVSLPSWHVPPVPLLPKIEPPSPPAPTVAAPVVPVAPPAPADPSGLLLVAQAATRRDEPRTEKARRRLLRMREAGERRWARRAAPCDEVRAKGKVFGGRAG